jgi:hypothetical protein
MNSKANMCFDMTKDMKIYFSLLLLVTAACGEYPKKLGHGYKIDYTSGYDDDKALVDSLNKIIVYGPILSFNCDSKFIIAAERPRDSVSECSGQSTFDECEAAFKSSTFKQYWIIAKKDQRAWGPYQFADYLDKREELNVPSSLTFKERIINNCLVPGSALLQI